MDGGPGAPVGPPSSAALALARRAAALPEVGMRVAAWSAALAEAPAPEAATLLDGVIAGALARDEACLAAYEALIEPQPLAAHIAPETWEEIRQAAQAAGQVGAMHWLWAHMADHETPRALDPRRLVPWGLREMTLGDRRALARRAQGDTLQALLGDPDGGVIANVLNNPRTTEADVLKIVSRRPTLTDALVPVLRSARWSRRYRIRLGLVRNPYLHLTYGLTLLVTLNRVDLEDVGADESLSATLRLGCQRLLGRKGRERPPDPP